MVKTLAPRKALAMPTFHPLTACDQTSFLAGIGKLSPWETWMAFDKVTSAFAAISNSPSKDVVLEILPDFERFVVLPYDRTVTFLTINRARKDLFTERGNHGYNAANICSTLQAY